MNKGLIQFFATALDSMGFNKVLESLSKKKVLTILAYHGVFDPMRYPPFQDEEFISASPPEFARHLDFVKEHFDVISFAKLKKNLDSGYLPEKALIITFDDGYRDNYVVAYPLLKERNLTATIFLTAGHIGTNRLIWFQQLFLFLKNTKKRTIEINYPYHCQFFLKDNDGRNKAGKQIMQMLRSVSDQKRETLMDEIENILEVEIENTNLTRTLLSWDEVREMHQNGIEFGSHTLTHPVLSQVSEEKLRFELVESKRKIEEEIGDKVITVSYPFGGKNALDEKVKQVAKDAGYEFGVSYIHGLNYVNTYDLFALNRLHVERVFNLPLFKMQLYWPKLLPHSRG